MIETKIDILKRIRLQSSKKFYKSLKFEEGFANCSCDRDLEKKILKIDAKEAVEPEWKPCKKQKLSVPIKQSAGTKKMQEAEYNK